MSDPVSVVRAFIEVQRTAHVVDLEALLALRETAKAAAAKHNARLATAEENLSACEQRIQAFEAWLAENPEPLAPIDYTKES